MSKWEVREGSKRQEKGLGEKQRSRKREGSEGRGKGAHPAPLTQNLNALCK